MNMGVTQLQLLKEELGQIFQVVDVMTPEGFLVHFDSHGKRKLYQPIDM